MRIKKLLFAVAAVFFCLFGLNSAAANSSATLTADNAFWLYSGDASGSNLQLVGSGSNWPSRQSFNFNVSPGDYLYVMALDFGQPHAWQGVFTTPAGTIYSDGTNWVATTTDSTTVDQAMISGATWGAIGTVAPANSGPWGNVVGDPNANWIWNSDFYSGDLMVLFRTAAPVGGSGGAAAPASLVTGFNLLGNASSASLDVAALFGDAAKVNTVWKWVASKQTWVFYSPTLADGGAAYAASKGYDFLTSINAGEGYWVNAISQFALPAQTGTDFNWTSFSFSALPSGFNLIAHSSVVTPSQFNVNVSQTLPASGVIPTDNFVSLWAWDAVAGTWYFYSPLLESSGGLAAVKAYADSHFFRHFQDYGKSLGLGTGFWVNRL